MGSNSSVLCLKRAVTSLIVDIVDIYSLIN